MVACRKSSHNATVSANGADLKCFSFSRHSAPGEIENAARAEIRIDPLPVQPLVS
jgi:hypothetical protein